MHTRASFIRQLVKDPYIYDGDTCDEPPHTILVVGSVALLYLPSLVPEIVSIFYHFSDTLGALVERELGSGHDARRRAIPKDIDLLLIAKTKEEAERCIVQVKDKIHDNANTHNNVYILKKDEVVYDKNFSRDSASTRIDLFATHIEKAHSYGLFLLLGKKVNIVLRALVKKKSGGRYKLSRHGLLHTKDNTEVINTRVNAIDTIGAINSYKPSTRILHVYHSSLIFLFIVLREVFAL
jgi:hypothetical protein